MELKDKTQRRSRVLTTPPADRVSLRSRGHSSRDGVDGTSRRASRGHSSRRAPERFTRRTSSSRRRSARPTRSRSGQRRSERASRHRSRSVRDSRQRVRSRSSLRGRGRPSRRRSRSEGLRAHTREASPRGRKRQSEVVCESLKCISPADNTVTISQLLDALRTISDKGSSEKLSNQNTVPEFDPANKEQTIAMWIHKVNECAVIYNWTDRQTVHFALPKLKGLAQKWYAGLPTVMFSWIEWQDKLKLAFPSDDNYGVLLSAMLAKRATFNDSLEEYFYEKIMLLNRCGLTGKRAVDCLVLGIDDRSVRLGAEAARFLSPDQLLPFLKSAKNSSISDRRVETRTDGRSEHTHKGAVIDKNAKCFNCQQEGHYKSQCPKPVVKCEKCMRFGHSSDSCRFNFSKAVDNVSKT